MTIETINKWLVTRLEKQVIWSKISIKNLLWAPLFWEALVDSLGPAINTYSIRLSTQKHEVLDNLPYR